MSISNSNCLTVILIVLLAIRYNSSKQFVVDLSCSCKLGEKAPESKISSDSKNGFTKSMAIKSTIRCPASFSHYDGFCYRLYKDKQTFHSSESRCLVMRGHLTSVHGKHEQDFLVGNLSLKEPVWIGLTDQETEGIFVWTDSSNADYTNWYSYEPNNYGNEDCTEMQKTGEWNDFHCEVAKQYICKVKPISE